MSIVTYIGRSAKFIVSGLAGIVLLAFSSYQPFYYIFGAIANAILSKVLKSILRVPRPVGSKKGGYGMPSSHAQSLFYFATVISGSLPMFVGNSLLTTIATVMIFSYALSASYWRVKSQLHTSFQTLVGAVLGSLAALCILHWEAEFRDALTDNGFELVLNGSESYPSIPLTLRLAIVGIGAIVLYKLEIKKLLKSERSE